MGRGWSMDTRAIAPVPARPRIDQGIELLRAALDLAISCRTFRRAHQRAATDFFGGVHCVFCGAAGEEHRLSWLHLVPIDDGGDTVAGNVVLACWHCAMAWERDSAKTSRISSLAALEPYRLPARLGGEAPWDVPSQPAVIEWSYDDRSGITECWGCADHALMRSRVASYVATFGYAPRAEEARLTEGERESLADLRRRIDEL